MIVSSSDEKTVAKFSADDAGNGSMAQGTGRIAKEEGGK